MFTKKEIRKLTSEEMAFAWFRYPKSIVSTLLSYMPIRFVITVTIGSVIP